MSSSSTSRQRELVFCHQCENEWYKDSSNGLTCPACHSDFTEIIDQDFDPRATQEPQHPLHSHNPWASAADPDEEDIGGIDAEQFGRGSGRGTQNFGPGAFEHNPYQQTVFGDFTSMLQTMTGIRGMPPGFGQTNQRNQGVAQEDGTFRPRSAPGMRQEGSHTRVLHQMGPHGGVRIELTSGPGFSFTTTRSGGNFSRGGQGGAVPLDNVNEILQGLFGGLPTGGSPNPIAAIFSSILDPANARQGDAVFSQEALDRVISQLMEQNPGGSAPGPASVSAIQRLPRKNLSVDMLDENTGQADCSICMDNVEVGEEVTTLPCGHWFHFACVEAWLKEHDTCPVCRRGIMPKDGSRDNVRTPGQAPLYDEDPVELGRRQSGTRQHPYVVDESPTRERRQRRPSEQRRSGSVEGGAGTGGGGGIADRVRSFLSGVGGSSSGSGDRRSGDYAQR